MLPISYAHATVRTVMPVCEASGRIGVAFNMDTPSGLQVVRLALDAANADVLCRLLADYMAARGSSQSAGSSLMPSDPRSVPSEGVNV